MKETVNVRIEPRESSEVLISNLVGLVVAVGATAIMIYVQRKMSDPDFFLTVKMRFLLNVSDYADKKARFWNEISSKATKLYLESRP